MKYEEVKISLLKYILLYATLPLCIGTASAIFLFSLESAAELREENLWIITLLPAAGVFIAWMYSNYGRSSEAGNNLILEEVQDSEFEIQNENEHQNKPIPWLMAPLIYIGTIITHLFGGSAGREGTAIQMAGSIADQFISKFKLSEENRKIFLLAAIAGGFGSVFGTPFAGAVFALEIVFVKRLNYKAIVPAFIIAWLSDFVCRLWGAPHAQYNIGIIPNISLNNIIYTILVGIGFGLCAYLFSKSLNYLNSQFKKYIKLELLRPFVAGILIVFGVYFLGTKYIGLGIPEIIRAFEVEQKPYEFALKIIFTTVTLAAGFKGGEVTPLFFIGAFLGNALSVWVPMPIGLLAGMGFVAVFAGATNTPIACTIMAIELFGTSAGIYFLIVCFTAYLFSFNTSIYSSQKKRQNKYYFI